MHAHGLFYHGYTCIQVIKAEIKSIFAIFVFLLCAILYYYYPVASIGLVLRLQIHFNAAKLRKVDK